MSIGFRIFVLIVLAFAALWVYRFREPELQRLFFGFQTQAQDRVPVPGSEGAYAELFPPIDPSAMRSPDWSPDGTWDPVEELPPQEWSPDGEFGENVEYDAFYDADYDAEYDTVVGGDLPDPDLLPDDPTELSEKDLKSDAQENDIDVKGISQSGERVSPRTHTVADKETLSRIARKYLPGNSRGVTLLFEANKNRLGLSSPNEIFAGQVLVIPSVDGTAKTD